MKRRIGLLLICLCISLPTFAYFQIAGSPKRSPGKQANYIVNDIPGNLRVNPRYTFYPAKGLLYTNLKNYAKKHGWKLRWTTKRDYRIVNNYKIAGPNFQSVVKNLLSNYIAVRVSFNTRRRIVYVGLKTK